MTKVLIIEDDQLIRKTLQFVLEHQGFQVALAENGTTGLDMATREIPDGILCDLLMPDINGVEVLKALRQNPCTYRIPVLFLSAAHDRKLFQEIEMIEPLNFLPKPFTITSLKASVARFIQN